MTTERTTFVDVYVLRGTGPTLEVLALRRSGAGRSPGAWEAVHGHLDAGERPVDGALRELREETGLAPLRFYNLSRVDSFYLHRDDVVMRIPAFVAFVAEDAAVRLSEEHDAFEWRPARSGGAFAWPREGRALADAVHLFATGDAGPLEDMLRIC